MTLLRTCLLALLMTPVASAQTIPDGDVRINEIRIGQPGSGDERYVEIVGPPGTSLAGAVYITVGEDVQNGTGDIETILSFAFPTIIIPPDGVLLLARTSPLPVSGAVPDYVLDDFGELTFENVGGNKTHFLLSNLLANPGDLDLDDDCVLDSTYWAAELDRVALIREENPPASGACHYGPPTVGPDGADVPNHVYYCNGTWVVGASDPAAGLDTPGEPNTNCPVPVEQSTWGAVKSRYGSE